jgi:hypothetical protein
MGVVCGVVMVAALGVSAVVFARALASRGIVDAVLVGFLVGSGEILLSGWVLSGLGAFGSAPAWAGAGVLWCALAAIASKVSPASSRGRTGSWRLRVRRLSGAERIVFLLPVALVVTLGAVNLVSALVVAPNTVDGLTYHLPRVGYYLQHGHLGWFAANYPPQAVQAKGSAVLMAWAFLASNRFEGAMLLVQYTSYWIALTAIYGIGRNLGASCRYAALGACIFGLLTSSLMQAPTPMNDLLVATYVGCALYFLIAFRRFGQRRDLVWSGAAIGMAGAVKLTGFVAMPALGIAAWYALGRGRWARDAITFMGSTVLALTVFALPAGYLDNYLRFGDPFTPAESLAKYAFGHKPWGYVLTEGSKNVLRLGLEFLSLDGLPPVGPVIRLQRIVRLPAYALGPLWLEEGGTTGRPGFAAYRDPRAHEEHAYWGVLGIGLLWIVPWVALCGTRRDAGVRIVAVAAIVYFLSVAYAGEYDPWRGRIFLAMGMFAVPVMGCFLEERQSRGGRAFTLVAVAAGCVSAISAIVFREHATLVAASYGSQSVSSILLQDRAGQMTSDIPKYAEAVRRYEAIVPQDATVAIYGDYMFEYVFFGARMTRRLVPLGDGRQPMRVIPDGTQFLVFSSKTLPPTESDVLLGQDWFLRRLLPSA